jgi:hypothetical protein
MGNTSMEETAVRTVTPSRCVLHLRMSGASVGLRKRGRRKINTPRCGEHAASDRIWHVKLRRGPRIGS